MSEITTEKLVDILKEMPQDELLHDLATAIIALSKVGEYFSDRSKVTTLMMKLPGALVSKENKEEKVMTLLGAQNLMPFIDKYGKIIKDHHNG